MTPVGQLHWSKGPVPNVVQTPIPGGQWIKAKSGPFPLRVGLLRAHRRPQRPDPGEAEALQLLDSGHGGVGRKTDPCRRRDPQALRCAGRPRRRGFRSRGRRCDRHRRPQRRRQDDAPERPLGGAPAFAGLGGVPRRGRDALGCQPALPARDRPRPPGAEAVRRHDRVRERLRREARRAADCAARPRMRAASRCSSCAP